MKKKYKVNVEIELEIDAPNKKQINNLVKDFKDNAKWKYESFGSKGRIKITNVDFKEVCESI